MADRKPAAPRHVPHRQHSAAPAASARSAMRAGRVIAAHRRVRFCACIGPMTASIASTVVPPGRNSTGSDPRKIEHGGFHAHRTRSAVEHGRDAPGQIVQDVLRRGGTHFAGAVRRGRGDRPSDFSQQRQRRGVRRDTHRQRIEPRAGQQAHVHNRRWRGSTNVSGPGQNAAARLRACCIRDHVGEAASASG